MAKKRHDSRGQSSFHDTVAANYDPLTSHLWNTKLRVACGRTVFRATDKISFLDVSQGGTSSQANCQDGNAEEGSELVDEVHDC